MCCSLISTPLIICLICCRDLAVDLLKMIPDSDLLLAKVCARCAASMAEINDIHAKVNENTQYLQISDAVLKKMHCIDKAVLMYIYALILSNYRRAHHQCKAMGLFLK